MSAPGYQEYPPDPRLHGMVACYWSSVPITAAEHRYPVLPDGCIDLLLSLDGSQLQVVGPMRRALWVDVQTGSGLVGVRFQPGAASAFLRERVDLLADRRVRAHTVLSDLGPLEERLLEAQGLPQRLALFERHLLAARASGSAPDPRMRRISSQLGRDPGARIETLAADLGLSRQRLRQLTLAEAGLPPKLLARVARLQRLVPTLRSPTPLAEAALASGYTDQAHMGREFKSLVGISPGAYRATCWRDFPNVQDPPGQQP